MVMAGLMVFRLNYRLVFLLKCMFQVIGICKVKIGGRCKWTDHLDIGQNWETAV